MIAEFSTLPLFKELSGRVNWISLHELLDAILCGLGHLLRAQDHLTFSLLPVLAQLLQLLIDDLLRLSCRASESGASVKVYVIRSFDQFQGLVRTSWLHVVYK